ncbi:tautomerase family protein [Pseudomonas ogarae]|uniref:tautomerase family protein n=1 Tax=Pseudomonas ogarae (strain DSM 112162 / CECT 30235 / F113) TaxID=1114970 RepID=UPI0009A2E035|nr:tautomerase family protein [Pseudomonas ogarae]OPG72097.1 tautomerase family protein [Pseudomonas ogarae]
MPVFHAHIPKGRFSREQKIAMGNALNRSLVVALGIPEGDRFIVISEHGDDELFIDPTFMEMERSVNAMIIEVQLGAHRPTSDKTALMAEICRQLGDAADIAPDDIFISLIPVPNENFSFGRGVAQLAGIPARW